MSLPAFSGLGSACPKCGIRSPHVKYVERASYAAYGSLAYRHGRDEDFPCVLRTCSTCGFQALEAPLSASDTLMAALAPTKQVIDVNVELHESTDYSGLDG